MTQFVEDDFEWYGRPNPWAAQIAGEQAKLEAAGLGAGSVPSVPIEGDALARAEASGNYVNAMQIKFEQIFQLLRP